MKMWSSQDGSFTTRQFSEWSPTDQDGKAGALSFKKIVFLCHASTLNICDICKHWGLVRQNCPRCCSATLQGGTRKTWWKSTLKRYCFDNTCMQQAPKPAKRWKNTYAMFWLHFSFEKLMDLAALTGSFLSIATVWLHIQLPAFCCMNVHTWAQFMQTKQQIIFWTH